MTEMKTLDQYLQRRGGRWHYIRRIPTRYRKLDPRHTIRTALDTSSLQVARARRDAMVETAMGAVPPVSDTLRQTFELCFDKPAGNELANKSPDQRKK